MAEIRIHREHQLGLAKARKIAWRWAEQVEEEFQMACTVEEGDAEDVVTFQRSGVDGRLVVAADHFDLHAKLGFLLGAFSKRIESEITKNLDALLEGGGSHAAGAHPKRKTAAAGRKAAGKKVKE